MSCHNRSFIGIYTPVTEPFFDPYKGIFIDAQFQIANFAFKMKTAEPM
jgi:hypothetical protein